ncbi:MAG: glycerol-3-phosphate acyltransferase [Candidatus Omnitrophota bacterium]
MVWISGVIAGYLIGSLSFAYLVTGLVKGVDIRTLGTGNAGAANVSREVGKLWGILVWFLDTAKGIAAVFVAALWSGAFPKPLPLQVLLLTLVGCAAVLGHSYPLFLKFKGGKGASTAGGLILYLFPKLFPLVITLFFLAQKLGPNNRGVILLSTAIFFLYLYGFYGASGFGCHVLSFLFLILTSFLTNRGILRVLFPKR